MNLMTWARSFERMQNVRTMTLRDRPMFPFIYALFPIHDVSREISSPPKLALPLLETLEFQGVSFRRKDKEELNLLRARLIEKGRDIMARVPKLVIKRCVNMDNKLKMLFEDTIAVVVEWDGVERTNDWEDVRACLILAQLEV